jgi:DedD protein
MRDACVFPAYAQMDMPPMRDLDRLQEQEPDERGRTLATLAVLATVIVGLFGAAFALWSRASGPGLSDGGVPDPLDRFLHMQPLSRAEGAGKANEGPIALDPAKLTFERSLTGQEDRPEVLAALESAAREEAHLSARSGESGAISGTGRSRMKQGDATLTKQPMPASLAASSAGPKLEKSAQHDKLVAAALPKPSKDSARSGTSEGGEFLLHVISYETKAPAEALARALRDRGHEAFVAAGEVNGRGRYYRVRIGPFVSKQAADAYRRAFETRERMNTIVVRRQDDE